MNLEWTDARGNAVAAVAAGAVKTKAVYQINCNSGEFIARFDQVKTAATSTDTPVNSIYACTTGRQKSGGGFMWTFVDPRP